MLAPVAGSAVQVGVEAINRFCQYPGDGRFAGTTWASEQVCVGYSIGRDGVAQRLDDVLLANHLFPAARPPFSIQGLGHAQSVSESGAVVNRAISFPEFISLRWS